MSLGFGELKGISGPVILGEMSSYSDKNSSAGSSSGK